MDATRTAEQNRLALSNGGLLRQAAYVDGRWVETARTLEVLADQARDGVPGVVMRESLALYREPPGRPEWTASVGSVREATAAELPPGYPYGLRFAVPQAEMPLYLPWLMRQVRDEARWRRLS